jgi:glutamine synthetase type III
MENNWNNLLEKEYKKIIKNYKKDLKNGGIIKKSVFLQEKTMAELRFSALREVFNRQPIEVKSPMANISDFFGVNVFDLPKMEKYLPKEAFIAIKTAIDTGTSINRQIAGQVATGLKAWALENGANHYTHWFHPLTDATAEKHDVFIERGTDGDGHCLPASSDEASS